MKKLGTIILGLLTTSNVFAGDIDSISKVLYPKEAYLYEDHTNNTKVLPSSSLSIKTVKALYPKEAYLYEDHTNNTTTLASSSVSKESIDAFLINAF